MADKAKARAGEGEADKAKEGAEEGKGGRGKREWERGATAWREAATDARGAVACRGATGVLVRAFGGEGAAAEGALRARGSRVPGGGCPVREAPIPTDRFPLRGLGSPRGGVALS